MYGHKADTHLSSDTPQAWVLTNVTGVQYAPEQSGGTPRFYGQNSNTERAYRHRYQRRRTQLIFTKHSRKLGRGAYI